MASSIYNYNSVKKMPTFDITFYSIVKNKLSNLKFNNQGNIYIFVRNVHKRSLAYMSTMSTSVEVYAMSFHFVIH